MGRTSSKARKQKDSITGKIKIGNSDVEENKDSVTDKENDESESFEVEKIVHTRVFRGKRQYLVRWKGYAEESDTWETESALESSKELLEEFKKENPPSNSKLNDEDSDEESKAVNPSQKKVSTKRKKTSIKKKNQDDNGSIDSSDNVELQLDADSNEPTSNSENEVNKKNKKSQKKTVDDTKVKKGKRTKNEPKEIQNKKAKIDDGSDNESVTDGKDYEVEKILEVHFRKDGKKEFLIRWKGYKSSDDTWEPEEHLDCQDLIEKFMIRVEKAKNSPRRELRELVPSPKRFVPYAKKNVKSLRHAGLRPCYQE